MSVLLDYVLWRVGLPKASTFYGAGECDRLVRYAAGLDRLVELGCWQGVNTSRLRRSMSPHGTLFAVDPYTPGKLGFSVHQRIAEREVGRVSQGTVRWLRMTDLAAAQFFRAEGEAPVDFIFSDTVNSFEGQSATWEAWTPLLRRGGIFVMANSTGTEFADQVLRRDPDFDFLESVGPFSILRRKPGA